MQCSANTISSIPSITSIASSHSEVKLNIIHRFFPDYHLSSSSHNPKWRINVNRHRSIIRLTEYHTIPANNLSLSIYHTL
ncbi:hypothetical protein EYC84_003461 [Monilinia fructicola]|uniref:Uncharacterized protein n=1 Tax=Monilinia fructicola TaxID=38448 RepID=A0A5M9JYD8_MONFR|nr:hypothetical protein EYC84_003461 [Monilinia fructicola]